VNLIFELSLVEKHGKKELQSYSHCGSFDHPDLQSPYECMFVFLVLQLQFEIPGACNTLLERYSQDLSNGILKAPKFLNFQLVNQKNKFAFV
jgi:hypothetical protein